MKAGDFLASWGTPGGKIISLPPITLFSSNVSKKASACFSVPSPTNRRIFPADFSLIAGGLPIVHEVDVGFDLFANLRGMRNYFGGPHIRSLVFGELLLSRRECGISTAC